MAIHYVKGRLKAKIHTTEEWESGNYPTLLNGEIGMEVLADGSRRAKVGDGNTAWANLPYITGPGNVTVAVAPTGSDLWIEAPYERVAITTTSPSGSTDPFVIELTN